MKPKTDENSNINAEFAENPQDRPIDGLIWKQDALDALTTQAEEMSHWHERYAEQRKGILTAINIVTDIEPTQEIKVNGRTD